MLSLLIVDGSDFRLPAELTFDVGAEDDTIRRISIAILDDRLVEGTESFNISGSAAPLGLREPVSGMTVVTILDNDCKCS